MTLARARELARSALPWFSFHHYLRGNEVVINDRGSSDDILQISTSFEAIHLGLHTCPHHDLSDGWISPRTVRRMRIQYDSAAREIERIKA